MATRRSLNGSLTVVGDIAQATGPLAPDSWDDVLAHLPDRQPSRVVGLSVGYRIPAQIMDLADRVMHGGAARPARADRVRIGDSAPLDDAGARPRTSCGAHDGRCGRQDDGRPHVAATSPSSCPTRSPTTSRRPSTPPASTTAGPRAPGSTIRVTVVPVSVVKGLELDGVVVVEPARIVRDEDQGLRALYVALTRPTQRLTIVHAEELPAAMRS